ncbi:hypothetical protein scyTo_0010931 [Scyliorhinus torazame]|uniref:Folate receptor-like domain-containing protein n=1 Tax=Scyliorhinus torazame TaxID=75743 RepID=A0A401PDB6_SCYTO|nr:hypothetical protein [Scyliorhinus torazame]
MLLLVLGLTLTVTAAKDILNICMDGKHHKTQPGFEGKLYKQVDQTWRNERIMHVPICKTDCEEWWADCREDHTCKVNWHKGWDWSSGINKCPTNSKCQKFSQVFPTPQDLCEKLWSNSYQYTQHDRGSGECIVMWFNSALMDNPNVAVAQHYAIQMGLIASASSAKLTVPLFLALLASDLL